MTRRVVAIVVAVSFAAVLLSVLLFTQQLASILRTDAVVFSRLYALTFQASVTEQQDVGQRLTEEALTTLLGELGRLRIPVVTTDTLGTPIDWAYLPFELEGGEGETARLREYVEELDSEMPPLELTDIGLQVHVGDPGILRRLRWIPWLQAVALLVIVGGGAWMIFTSFRSERERIWSAMARESAHQMGTPLSSLVGWLEQLEARSRSEEDAVSPDLVREMGSDVDRLLKVSRRFELIGRHPVLESVSLGEIVEQLRSYFSARLPTLGSRVRFAIEIPADAPRVRGNETLLEWAFENLIKNSLDALAGQDGVIGVDYLGLAGDRAVFRVFDDGPGVAHQVRSKLFEIGVTTKEGGWGVGLSLTRRIVEEVHGGQISLDPGTEGASFRVELPVAGAGPA